ncbi:hypothetical protein GCM10022247_21790 [Allokutzneria multivorans]|uniref:Uncharacterized protein n=1 Tax=Allokutzneria multivorans TaxID=1142134 RepID=A0ABP7RQJ8_9PSEU
MSQPSQLPPSWENPSPPKGPSGKSVLAWFTQRRLIGLSLAITSLVLWPFTEWSWWPLAGALAFGFLVRILRLDQLLPGWSGIATLAVAAVWLVNITTGWSWAILIGLLVLALGVPRLPRFELLIIGVVLVVVGTIGAVWWRIGDEQVRAEQRAQDSAFLRVSGLPPTPVRALRALLAYIGKNDPGNGHPEAPGGACGLLSPVARAEFAAANNAPDCTSAVRLLADKVTDPLRYPKIIETQVKTRETGIAASLDACQIFWEPPMNGAPAGDPGPPLGRLELQKQMNAGWLIMSYKPTC